MSTPKSNFINQPGFNNMSAFKHVIPEICSNNSQALANSQQNKIPAPNNSCNNGIAIPAYNCSGKATSPADLTNNLSSFSNSLMGVGGSFLTGYNSNKMNVNSTTTAAPKINLLDEN